MAIPDSRRAAVLASAAEDLAGGADRRILAEELADEYDLSVEEARAVLEEARPSPPRTPRSRSLGRVLLFLLLVVTRLGLFHQWLPDTDMWLVAALGTLCYVLCSGWAARARIRRLVLRG